MPPMILEASNDIFPAEENNRRKIRRVPVLDDSDELLLSRIRLEMNEDVPILPEVHTAEEIRHIKLKEQLQKDELSLPMSQELQGVSSWESEPIINLVDSLLDQALDTRATDIHIEPGETSLRIRFRQDGLLRDFKKLPLWICDPVLVRIKIISGIDITDKRIPHDGSFVYTALTHKVNVRVSTLPVTILNTQSEKCVLRLLSADGLADTKTHAENSPAGKPVDGLTLLQLSDATTRYLRQVFDSPQGLFLVTGPTGSGKTTTLHTGLKTIIPREINVTTIEDPVEYVLEGANQVQVNDRCGFTFANALRSILRQDPDVILVGEIRDRETALIAIQAAQTGHLVLSTLHTNDAKGAYTRLKDLGISETILQESLLGILAQRLVRTIPSGRRAIVELLKPDKTYVDGTLVHSARSLEAQNIITREESTRVLGNLFYIKDNESF